MNVDTYNNTTTTLPESPKALMADCLVQVSFLKDREIQNIINLFSIQTFTKGNFLLTEGETPRATYQTYKGCIRQFYLKDGEEKTTAFYTEDQAIDAITSSFNNPSPYYLECLEDTTVITLHQNERAELFKHFPRFEALYRMDLEQKFHDFYQRFAHFRTSTPEERYLDLLDTRPELFYRVPQYQLASYLGIKPESLSRIRRRIASK